MDNRYILCDIDGTIADITHRLHFIQTKPKDWDSFYSACDKDTPVNPIRKLLEAFALTEDYDFVYSSGRREETRGKTCTWLVEHSFPSGQLYMRRDGDYRSDVEVKREMYETIISPRHGKPLLVLDDRDSVVALWRELCLTCLQVKNGDY